MDSPLHADSVLTEFKRLYHLARKEHTKAERSAVASSPAHQAALAWAEQHSIPAGKRLLEAYLAGWQGRDEEALALLNDFPEPWPPELRGEFEHIRAFLLDRLHRTDEAIAGYQKALSAPGYERPVDALRNLGMIHAGKGEYDRAINCYERALATPGLTPDQMGDVLNCLALAHFEKGEHETAIVLFKKALEIPGYESPGAVLSNLGMVYTQKKEFDLALEHFTKALDQKGVQHGPTLNNIGALAFDRGDFDEAIKYCEQALTDPNYEAGEHAFYNLGLAYAAKGEFVSAIRNYEKVIESSGQIAAGVTLNNIALAYDGLGRWDDALKMIDRVLKHPDRDQQHERAKNIRTQILAAKAKIQPSQEEQALVSATITSGGAAADTPESRMKQKLLGKDDKYSDYIKRESSKRDNTFSVLRGWSSAVTLLEGGTGKQWRGGGYFLKWNGRGLVLDPGFDFIDNFHDAGFHAREVDAVVVSHNHPDHNFDLGSLDDLRFEIFRRQLRQLPDKTWEPALAPTLFAIDEDTAAVFKDDSPKHRGKPIRFTGADYERERWLDRENDLQLRIEHFPVQHGKDVPNARGIRLILYDTTGGKDFVIGYTGDTFYFNPDPETGDPGLAEQLKGCDVLLAHISQPMTQEFDDPNFPKPVHLGYNGVAKLVLEVKPKLTLIGEFWAGLADLRLDLIQGLRRRCGIDTILPTGLGFHLTLPSLEVECTRCRLSVPFSQIKVAPPTTPFGPLGYLCPKCLV